MKYSLIALAVFAAIPLVAQAAETQKEEESSPSNEVSIIAYRGDVAVKLYMEHEVMENLVVYLNVSKSKGFGEVTVGPAYYITPELQVGVSAGVARYAAADEDREASRRVVSGFIYYKSDAVEGELSVSRYSRDPEPVWYQTYIQVPISGNWAAGFYGEKGVGWGPRLAVTPYKNVTLSLSPLIKREGGNKLIAGASVAF